MHNVHSPTICIQGPDDDSLMNRNMLPAWYKSTINIGVFE